jgi:uncharacterized membrane protein YczE
MRIVSFVSYVNFDNSSVELRFAGAVAIGREGIATALHRVYLANWRHDMLRTVIFLVLVGAGVLVGAAAAPHGDWSLRFVMAGLGAIVGAAVGGAVVRLGRKATERRVIPGLGTTTSDIAANFWRDKGRPPT